MKRTIALIAVTSICLIAAPALAQDGPRSGRRQGQARQLDPEKAKAAWKLQAEGVASRLGVDEAGTAQVVSAYVAARTSHTKAVQDQRRKMREEREASRDEHTGDGSAVGGERSERQWRGDRTGRGAELREANRALMKTERARLEESLTSVLSGEDLEQAVAALGTFNGQWDRLVNAVAGLDASKEKTMSALGPIETYVASITKIRAGGDRSSMRESMRGARDDLHASLSYVLTEPQVEKVLATMSSGRRRGPGGGEGRGERRERSGGDGA